LFSPLIKTPPCLHHWKSYKICAMLIYDYNCRFVHVKASALLKYESEFI
jgi:hypothetical protein